MYERGKESDSTYRKSRYLKIKIYETGFYQSEQDSLASHRDVGGPTVQLFC